MTISIVDHTASCQYSHDGATWVDFADHVRSFRTHHAYDADRGTVEIACKTYPSGLRENDYLIVYMDGVPLFDGRVARPARAFYVPDATTIYGEGRGAYLAKNWRGSEIGDPDLDDVLDDGFNRVYENQEDGAIITNLCEAAGIEVDKHEVENNSKLRG